MPDPDGKGIYFVNGISSGFLTSYHVHSRESTDLVSADTSQPAISPDGKRVMYITLPEPQRSELWVSNIDGGNRVKIATGEILDTGRWAPDSSQLSFDDRSSRRFKLYIAGSDGSNLHQLPGTRGDQNSSVWSPDKKSVYVSSLENKGSKAEPTVWKENVDGSNPEKVVDACAFVFDASPDGEYLLGWEVAGGNIGISEVSIADRKCTMLLPGVVTFGAVFAPDGKSFLYAIASHGEVTIYRQPWKDGKLSGASQVALKVPFVFPLMAYDSGNAYDFSRDLSTIVYARPGGHALSPKPEMNPGGEKISAVFRAPKLIRV
jgi:hypothetical protein